MEVVICLFYVGPIYEAWISIYIYYKVYKLIHSQTKTMALEFGSG